jgi:hypothetical protein
MEIAGSVLLAFSAGVFIGVVVMAMMFVSSAEDEPSTRSRMSD